MQLFILSLILIAIAFSAIGIKMFFVKGGTFVKQCSTIDTGTNTNIGCSCGENSPEDRCENFEEHHGKGANAARHIHTETMVVKSW